MLVHRPGTARSNRGCALKLGPAVNEAGDRVLEGSFATCPVSGPGPRDDLIRRCAMRRDDQRNSARSSFGRDQTEGLGFAAVNQSVRACQEPGKLRSVGDRSEDRDVAILLGDHFELLPFRAIADEH